MNGFDVSSPYAAKAFEYLIAVAFLVLFIPFWRYVAPAAVEARRAVRAQAPAARPRGWFDIPDPLWLHPGHAWVRDGAEAVVTVGYDDFARAVIGDPAAIETPPIWAPVHQGAPAFTVATDAGTIRILSPVDGVVVGVNDEARRAPGGVSHDPYRSGWVLKVLPTRWESNVKQLVRGEAARRFLDDAGERLQSVVAPELGAVLADGGAPVHGIARDLEPEAFRRVADEFFLNDSVPKGR